MDFCGGSIGSDQFAISRVDRQHLEKTRSTNKSLIETFFATGSGAEDFLALAGLQQVANFFKRLRRIRNIDFQPAVGT